MFSSSKSKKERGQGLVEYSLILVLVAIVVIGALTVLGPIIGNVFTDINSSISTAGTSNGGETGINDNQNQPSQSLGCSDVWPDGYATGPGYCYDCYSPSKAAANNGWGGYNIPH